MNEFDKIAADYDEDIYPLNEKEFVWPTVQLLEQLAPGRRIMEFAAGTGRIAIPLAERGFQVTGVDLSEKMLEVLKNKKGGGKVAICQGDMKKIDVKQKFDMVYLVFNGITYLLSQEEQLACFQNAARHLEPGGIFVIETFLPDLTDREVDGAVPFALSEEYIGFDQYDRISQKLVSLQLDLTDKTVKSHQTVHRYLWPSEMVLMGKLAGMECLHQWGSWERKPLESSDKECILVWRKNESDCGAE